jgi:hypothetical protein
MSLYKETDKDALIENYDKITQEVSEINLSKIKPTIEQSLEIKSIVVDFVIEKKRKIYRGYAINELIKSVDPKDKIYQDNDVKSNIDFYSPTPIEDAKEIAKRLHAKGFCHIQARMAMSEETYIVFAETNNCADISYVPRNIYNRIPYKEVNGMYLTGPHFMMIDHFKILTDPLTSYGDSIKGERLEKAFTRLCLLMKYFPLPHNPSSIDIIPPEKDLDTAFRTIHDFLIERDSMIIVGMYAYNHLIRESEIFKKEKKINRSKTSENDKESSIKFVDVNYYEIITTNYKTDARDLILALQGKFASSGSKITYRENYPFFQYLGFNVDIYCDQEIICRMYHYNYKCIPFWEVPALYFTKSSYDHNSERSSDSVKIGTMAVQMMYNLTNIMRARTNNDKNTTNLYYTMISHIIDMKEYYFAKTGKTIFDASLFQEFVLKCIGFTNTLRMETAIRIEKRIKARKKPSWSYNPKADRGDRGDVYVFKNSSGNPINKERNKKIDLSSTGTCPDEDNVGEEEEDEDNSSQDNNDNIDE